jgi:hypothetical protein
VLADGHNLVLSLLQAGTWGQVGQIAQAQEVEEGARGHQQVVLMLTVARSMVMTGSS